MTARRFVWAGVTLLALTLSGYFVLCVPACLPGDDIGRPRTVKHRAECLLEEWGVIPKDPFRHIGV